MHTLLRRVALHRDGCIVKIQLIYSNTNQDEDILSLDKYEAFG